MASNYPGGLPPQGDPNYPPQGAPGFPPPGGPGYPPPGGGLPPTASGMVDRLKRLWSSPRTEWPRIAAEPMVLNTLFVRWAVPLAAIGPVCSLIGQQLFGVNSGIIRFKPPLAWSVETSVSKYLVTLVGAYAMALVIDALAPTFGAVKNPAAAMKIAVFSSTAAWVAGVFGLIPALALLGIVGLYGLYLFWIGLPILMRPRPDRTAAYAASVIGVLIVIYLVIAVIVGQLVPATPLGLTTTTIGTGEHTVTITGS